MPDRGWSARCGVLLTIDRGNSTLDCCLHGLGAVRRERLPPDASLTRFLGDLVPDAAAGVTVVRGGLDRARAELAQRGVGLRVAGVELTCPLQIAYPDPTTLGADRWVGAVAARARFGDAIVVDCGTAVTLNLVTADGRFLGGAIGAGLGTIAHALAQRAPALPVFDGRPPQTEPAVTSEDAVRIGVGVGFVAMVEALAGRLSSAAGLVRAVRVATGGDADALLALGARAFVVMPELIHEGLCLLHKARVDSSC